MGLRKADESLWMRADWLRKERRNIYYIVLRDVQYRYRMLLRTSLHLGTSLIQIIA
jgi:hypothetical protein